MELKIQRIQNTCLTAADAGALADFYQKALGLRLEFRDDDPLDPVRRSGNNFAIAGPREAAAPKGAVVVFQGNDLATACERFEERGGQVVKNRDMGAHGKVATLADYAGHTI